MNELNNQDEHLPSVTAKYPEGAFKINDTKVVYAKKGTPYLALAKRFEVPLARLFEFNELKEGEEVDRDRLIYLQRKRKSGDEEYHIVLPGETLHDIAQLEAIRLESLLEYNFLKAEDRPAPGERLNLKKRASSSPKLALKENYSLHN